MKPHLLVDVDGVLNPLSFWSLRSPKLTEEQGWETHAITVLGTTYTVRLNKKLHTPMFARLAEHFEIFWATTWDIYANEHIAPRLDLPLWPVVPNCDQHGYAWSPLYHKTKHIVEWAKENRVERFVWLDDQPSMDDQAYFDSHLGEGVGKIFFIDSEHGLTEGHEKELLAWLGTSVSTA